MKTKTNPDINLSKINVKKILLTMKISFLLIIFSVVNLYATSIFSQNMKISVEMQNVTVREVINEIERHGGINFLFNDNLEGLSNNVTVSYVDQPIKDILENTLNQADITYEEIKDNFIVLLPKPDYVNQQQITISGSITDGVTGEPLPGASIIVRGTTIGTIADVNGNYSLNVRSRDDIVVFSFIGYITQNVLVGENTIINITLDEDITLLDEIVVVGYGSMQRQHLTGAVGSIRMDGSLEYRPTLEFGATMYGQVAGVQVLNTSGRPGMSSAIQIRGINSISAEATPLIVIDGIVLPDFDLSTINAADIESIHILKDAASASIYGSRAANGVILVTTKSGKPGKPTFSVHHSSSLQQISRKLDVMNTAEYAQASIDAAQRAWIDRGGDPNAPNTIEARGAYKYTWPLALENPETLPDTDWYDVLYRLAPMHKTDITLNGGDENTTYLISAGILNQEGILMNTDYQRYSLNLKADSKVTRWLKIGGLINTNFSKENKAGEYAREAANQYPTIYPVYGEDGYLGGPQNTPGFENYDNIFFRAQGHPLVGDSPYRVDGINTLNSIGNVFGEVTILPGLTFRSSLNAFIRRVESRFYQQSDMNLGTAVVAQPRTDVNMSQALNYTALNYFSYANRWDNHQIDAVAGYEFNQSEFYGISARRTNYENDKIPYLTAGRTINIAADNAYASSLISAFARVNYNYDNKYMFTASMRRDGSSRFGPANKWGNFPAISAGWRISEEDFMDNIDFLTNLNFRVSYGFTGNEKIGNYRWISSMAQSRVAFGNNLALAYYPSSVQNPDLRWERTKQQNLGIDLGLIDRIFLETDIYKSITDDLLLNVPIPSTSGFSSVLTNIGAMENKGIEFKLTTLNLVGEFSWRSLFTISANRNEVTKLGPEDAPLIVNAGNNMHRIVEVGSPIFSFYGLQHDGVYMNQAEIDADPASYPAARPGDARYRDVDGNGSIDANDRVITGNNAPDYIWGLSNFFRYKNFDLNIQFQGVKGMDVIDLNFRRSFQYHEGRNYNRQLLDRWRSEDEPGNGQEPKLSVDNHPFTLTSSSYFVQDGSYIRLQEVTLGYNLPRELASRMGFSSARAYFSGTNLFNITDYTGYDPESQNSDATVIVRRGVNHSVYPTARTFTFGINVEF